MLVIVVVFVNQTLQHELCTSVGDSPQTNPIIARIARKSGHGCGQPTQKMVEFNPAAYIFSVALLLLELGVTALTISDTECLLVYIHT